jgi:predicted metal-dependent HD superfamily phosphohydrolase
LNILNPDQKILEITQLAASCFATLNQEALAAELSRALSFYEEPARHHHIKDHPLKMIAQWHQYAPSYSLAKPKEFELLAAIVYHDCVWQALAQDSEERSAEWASNLHAAGIPATTVSNIQRAILCTKSHQCEADDIVSQLLIDLDLEILADEDAYWTYEANIRKEFAMVSDEAFSTGRAAFLEKQLAKLENGGHLFQTQPFIQRAEPKAKLHLEEELAALKENRKPWLEGH